MDALQTWIVVGVPGIVLALGFMVGASPVRAMAGYFVLALTFVAFIIIPQDVASASLVGLLGMALLAAGRGGEPIGVPEHHETRDDYTRPE